MIFQSTKILNGYTACFRQWLAGGTPCHWTHGYSIYFKLTFGCTELDERNWVFDFGGFKRAKEKIEWEDKLYNPVEWFSYMFDHTTIVSESDPGLEWFKEGERQNIIQLRILKDVGCERFAELVHNVVNDFVVRETKGRAKIIKVECFEQDKNSAIYE